MKSIIRMTCLFICGLSFSQTNLLDTSIWTVGTGSVVAFNANGDSNVNIREMAIGPHGTNELLWKRASGISSTSSGGWTTDYINVDHTKNYRLTVWIKKTNSDDGRTLFGFWPKDASGGFVDAYRLTGTGSSNAYFGVKDNPSLDDWYLFVAYIYDSSYTNTIDFGGIYNTTSGNKDDTLNDYVFDSATSQIAIRTYLYDETNVDDSQYFYDPTIYEVNGQEPTIQELIDGPGGADTQAPTAPILSNTAQTDTNVDLSWTAATDDTVVTTYKVYKDGVLEATLGDVLNYQIIGLIIDASYDFTVTALDAAGNESVVSNTLTVNTLPCNVLDTFSNSNGGGVHSFTYNNPETLLIDFDYIDNSFQVDIAGINIHSNTLELEGSTVTTGEIDLVFQSDNAAITSPWLSNSNGLPRIQLQINTLGLVSLKGTRTSSSTILETLVPSDGSTFNTINFPTGEVIITITNFDESGVDAISGSITVSQNCNSNSDTQAPTTSTLSSTGQTDTTLDLSWTAATDDTAVTGYNIYKDGVLETTLGNVLSYQVTGLTAATSYNFTVTVLDATGNESVVSNTVAITTDTASGGGGSGNWSLINQDVYYNTGNVGIGTDTPDEKLAVNGNIHAKEVRVDLNNWPDYVFTKAHNLLTLKEVEKHIQDKGHLPNIPSAKEVEINGIKLGKMNAKLLEKIEELTLYILQQQKQINQLEKRILKEEHKN